MSKMYLKYYSVSFNVFLCKKFLFSINTKHDSRTYNENYVRDKYVFSESKNLKLFSYGIMGIRHTYIFFNTYR